MMSLIKGCLVITFFCLFGITSTSPVKQEEAPYSITNIWKSSRRDCSCKREPDWAAGVQKYYDDIKSSFSTFPGPLAEQGDLVKTTFETFLTKLVNYSNSNSTVLSSGSSAILGALNNVNIGAKTSDGVIKAFYSILPNLAKAYRGIVTNSSKIIGSKASCAVNDAITDLECVYTKYMTEFQVEDEHGLRKEVSYEPVTQRAEKLKKTIASVIEANKCPSVDYQDASTVLTLILDHLMICFHGLSGCSQAILYEQKCKQPPVRKYVITVRLSFHTICRPVTVVTNIVKTLIAKSFSYKQ